jgi:hypothetical protein
VGQLFLFDLEDGTYLGEAKLQATNSPQVNYTHKVDAPPEKERENALSSLRFDLKQNICRAARNVLGGD